MDGYGMEWRMNGLTNSFTPYSIPFSSISAFVWDSIRLEFEAANNCVLRTRGALFGRSAYGIGLQKGSPWTPHISQAILRLSESWLIGLEWKRAKYVQYFSFPTKAAPWSDSSTNGFVRRVAVCPAFGMNKKRQLVLAFAPCGMVWSLWHWAFWLVQE
jgi:hypothetical protein